MPLTDTFIRALKTDTKPRQFSDGGGMYVFVPVSGAKAWRLAYSFAGKQKTLAMGVYPAVSLAAAREARDEAKALLAQGIDPGRQKKLDWMRSTEAAGNTFLSNATDLRGKLIAEGRSVGTMTRFDYLVGFANSDLGKLPLTEITAAEVLDVLRKTERRGSHNSAVKLRMTIGLRVNSGRWHSLVFAHVDHAFWNPLRKLVRFGPRSS